MYGSKSLSGILYLPALRYGPNGPAAAMISAPSFALPSVRGSCGSSSCLIACSNVTVFTLLRFGSGAKRGFLPVSFSFSPS